MSPNHPEKDSFIVEEVLSNFPVLRNIFSFLSDEDLERCCHVSQYWRTVADPFVFSHYQIQLGDRVESEFAPEDTWETDDVIIRERARYNRRIFTTYKSDFEGVSKMLENDLLTHKKVSITLTIRARTDAQRIGMKNFLSKFGPLVQDLSFGLFSSLPLNTFCKLLLNDLPNLRKLNYADLNFKEDSTQAENIGNVDSPKIEKLKHLKKLFFRNYVTICTAQAFETILKIAPSLDEIQHLPFQLIEAVAVAGKDKILKSITYNFSGAWQTPESNLTFVSALQKLAQLEPKLTSFEIPSSSYPYGIENFYEIIKPLVFSIMESSKLTLETLYIIPSSSRACFQNYPRLESLKTLEFGRINFYDRGFFPANFSLTETFPNVREVSVDFDLARFMMNYLPENFIDSWGFQIKGLRVQDLNLDTLLMLHRRFPSIEKFQFFGESNVVAAILPALAEFWPDLKSLTIGVNHCSNLRPRTMEPLKLDCVFTGLSEEIVDLLLDSSRRGYFTDEEIQGFKDESPMRKFKELRDLTLVFKISCLEHFKIEWVIQNLMEMSPLANEFGFKLLPHLKVTLEIAQTYPYIERIKTTLEPLARSDNIYIDDHNFDLEWPVASGYYCPPGRG